MNTHRLTTPTKFAARLILFLAITIFLAAFGIAEQPTPAATAAFNTYAQSIEARLAHQHNSTASILAPTSQLAPNQIVIENLSPTNSNLDNAMLHHWRATAFVPYATAPGATAPVATAEALDRILQNFSAYPQYFAPQVLTARIITQSPNQLTANLRVRQQHVITVVLDSTYNVTFAAPNPHSGYSISRSTNINEIASPGTPNEHALNAADQHGFLYRQNTYWTWEQRDHGLYLQVESISLTRAVPRGLNWLIGPYIQSVPRDSLEFTLRAVINALPKK